MDSEVELGDLPKLDVWYMREGLPGVHQGSYMKAARRETSDYGDIFYISVMIDLIC